MAGPNTSGVFRRLAKNLGWLMGSRGFAAIASIGYLAIAARSLGPRGFGDFTVVLTYGQLIATIIHFQSFKTVIRYGALHLARDKPRRLARLTGLTAVIDWGSGVAGAVIAVLLAPLVGPLFHWDLAQQHDAQLFAAVLLLTTGATPAGILRLFDRFDLIAYTDAIEPGVRIFGSILVWLLGPTLGRFLVIWALAVVVQVGAQWFVALRTQGVPLEVGPRRFARAVRENRRIARFMLQTNLSSTLNSTMQLGVLAVGAVAGPIDAGGFRIAQRLAKGITNPVETVTRALYPEMARLVAEDDHTKLRHVLFRVCLIAAALGALATVVAWLGAPLILNLIAGPQYAFARPFFVLLMIAAAIELAGFALEPFHTAHGRAGRVLRIRLVTAATYLALTGLLLPLLGALGAAVASVGAAMISFAQFVHSTRQILRTSIAGTQQNPAT